MLLGSNGVAVVVSTSVGDILANPLYSCTKSFLFSMEKRYDPLAT